MIPAGQFDQRITVQQKTLTKNAMGESTFAWATFATLWAKIMPLRGKEFITANQEQHTLDARFIVRTRSGLTTGMRMAWKSENYDIVNLIPGTAQYAGTIEIHAIKGARDGR